VRPEGERLSGEHAGGRHDAVVILVRALAVRAGLVGERAGLAQLAVAGQDGEGRRPGGVEHGLQLLRRGANQAALRPEEVAAQVQDHLAGLRRRAHAHGQAVALVGVRGDGHVGRRDVGGGGGGGAGGGPAELVEGLGEPPRLPGVALEGGAAPIVMPGSRRAAEERAVAVQTEVEMEDGMGSWGGRQHDGDEAHELELAVKTTMVCHALHWGH